MAAMPLKRVAGLRGEKVESVRGFNNYIGLEHIESHTGKAAPNVAGDCAEGSGNIYQPGDVLFGKLRPYLAKAWMAEVSGVCTTEALVLQPTGIDPRYLRYFLLAPVTIHAVDAATSGAKMPRADWDFIGQLSVPVTELHIQSTIADFLDRKTAAIDTLIAKKEELIRELNAYREAVIAEAVAPREGWLVVTVKRLVSIVKKGATSAASSSTSESSLAYLTPEGFKPYQLTAAPSKRAYDPDARSVFDAGDVAFCIIASVGKCASIAEPTLSNPQVIGLKPRSLILSDFLTLALRAQQRTLNGVANTSVIPYLPVSELLSHKVAIPETLAEQAQVLHRVERLLNQIHLLQGKTEESVAMLKEYRASLISEAVTGKLAIN